MSKLAQQLIAECKRTKAKSLDLGRCGLYEWPKELFELTWLEELNLRNRNWEEGTGWVPATENQGGYNVLREVPDSIGKLKELKKLDLGGSGFIYAFEDDILSSLQVFYDNWEITDLQPISQLANLQTINLAYTQITDLQPISQLANLQTINLAYTQITDLQPISQLANLQSLNLESTKITDLQPISQLANLQTINLAYTQITDLQPISQLANLQSLNLESTKITDLQPISQLANLQTLNIRNTQITDLQPISQLANLQTLNIRNTQITDLQPISQLANLQSLNLESTKITDLQPISQLANLQTINLAYTQITDLQPISQLANLQTLNIRNTQITDLQPISQLANLQSLNLESTKITDLQPISQLANLQTLNLWSTKITDLQPISQLANLQSLNLESTKITDLQPISQLANLQSLNLESTKITDLQPISQLANLQTINLAYTQITDLQPISQLANLQTLNIRNTQITDLQPISQLANLQTINLAYTQITDLQPISQLANLQSLNLESTKITDLQPISQLANLQTINLAYTQITDLQPISQLANLQTLNIRNTQITDLQPISQLANLQTVDLRNTQVNDLGPLLPLIEKGVPVAWHKDYRSNRINVFECPLTSPDPETVKRGNEAILAYFQEIALQGSAFIHEAKLLILGEGGAGKTTLARKLMDRNAPMPLENESTKGIDIQAFCFKPQESEQDFNIHIWDFGGQEIYHATHQFFLTKRSLYILVDDTRKDDRTVNDASFNYWLQIVELFGDGSPLLIVQNEKGDRSKAIDMKGMQARFGFIKDQYQTNLLNGRGVDEVAEAIRYHVQQLPHIGQEVPKHWLEIRKELQKKALEEPFMDDRDFYKICEKHEIPERERANKLSEYLHDLGVFLHFQEDPLLRRYVILKNEWATDAAYRVLDDEKVKRKLGRFDRKDVQRLWQDRRYAYMHDELLALMRKFELCYELHDGRYLVPQLLPPSEPQENDWDDSSNLQLRYRYVFMPKGLLSRFIVRMHRYVQNPNLAWRSGVILERDGTKARVVEQFGKEAITIQVRGSESREFMTIISEEFDLIHAGFDGLKVMKRVPCICSECRFNPKPHFYDHKNLMRRKEKGKRTVECDRSYEEVSVEALLDAVFVTNLNKPRINPLKLFFSYSKADKAYLEELKTAMAPWKRKGELITWDDNILVPGEEWDTRIKSELHTADIILLLVSSDAMATDYIYDVELKAAMERHYQGKAVVVPIILRPCMWELAEFSKLAALPRKGKPVSTFENQDEAWVDVLKELQKVIENLRARKV